MVDFIGVYDKVISPDVCKKIIDFFEDNKDFQSRGRYVIEGQITINPKVKDSMDMPLSFNDGTTPSTIIAEALNDKTPDYIDTYKSTDVIDVFSVEMGYNFRSTMQVKDIIYCIVKTLVVEWNVF